MALRWAFPVSATLVSRASDKPLVLGRGEDCDVILMGAEASRHHAELSLMGSLWVLRDLGSTNGCYVTGKRVEQAPLGFGKEADRIRRARELEAPGQALERHEGNLARAAWSLGISRQKAYRLLERLPAPEMDAAPRRGACSSKRQRSQ